MHGSIVNVPTNLKMYYLWCHKNIYFNFFFLKKLEYNSTHKCKTYWILNRLLMTIHNHWQLFQEKVFNHLDYSIMHILKNIIFLCCFLAIQDHLLHVHTTKTQVELTSVNRKISYHVINIYFQTIEILIHFILFSIGIHIQK
jgi:hypothetical protein